MDAFFRGAFGDLAVPKESLALFAAGGENAAGGKPPDEIELALEGQWVTHPTGLFKADEKYFASLIANFKAYGTKPVVDIEHSSALPWDTSPAQGYIEDLRVGPHGDGPKKALFGRVSWSDVGRANIENGRFRYVSQGVALRAKDRQTGKDIGPRLDHVALVKKPFIEGMEALFSSHFPGHGRAEEARMNDLIPKLRQLFKAAADADESVLLAKASQLEPLIVAGIEQRPGVFMAPKALEVLKCSATASGEEVSRAIVELAEKASKADVLGGRVDRLEDERRVRIVDEAIAAFKIAPAEKEEQLLLAKANPELFEKLLAKRTAQRPSGDRIATKDKPRVEGGDEQALFQAQAKVLDEYLAAHKDASERDAILAVAKEHPELFPTGMEVSHA